MTTANTNVLAHGKVVHELKRRVRIISPVLSKDLERAYILEILLKKRQGILKVRTVVDIASLTIHFDPAILPKATVLTLVDALLDNIGQKKPNNTHTFSIDDAIGNTVAVEEFNLAIEGMTCVSCALLIEMLLSKDPRILSANVNFAAEKATIIGKIDKDSLCKLIEKIGYRARNFDTLTQRKLLIEREQQRLREAKTRAILAVAFSLPVMIIGMAAPTSRFWHWAQHALATPIVLWAGKPFFVKAYKLARQGATNMDSLIALGVGSSYGYSVVSLLAGQRGLYFDSATGIISFVLIGRQRQGTRFHTLTGRFTTATCHGFAG
jgi:Cu+-exporting ATPase